MNERELELGLIGKKSWHDQYKDSAWVFIGGLPYDLTEGDVIAVFSQYGFHFFFSLSLNIILKVAIFIMLYNTV